MGFEWVSKKPNDGVATLYDSNITLNKAASSHFEHAYSVLLGLDSDSLKIAVKPITKEKFQLGAISEEKKHKITVRASYARVCNKKFMMEVAEVAGLDFSDNNSFKFKAKWSKIEAALIIDLKDLEV